MRAVPAPWAQASGLGERLLGGALVLLLTGASFILAAPAHGRDHLDFAALMQGADIGELDYSAFAPGPQAAPASNHFEGRLRLDGKPRTRTRTRLADFVSDAELAQARTLPADFSVTFVQDADVLIPVQRGPMPSTHGWWEFIVEPGRVWDEPGDQGYTRAAIPFSLQERNANCTHQGVLLLLFRNDGTTSHAALRVAGETCRYLKLDMWGTLRTHYDAGPVAAAAGVVRAYHEEVAQRLPVRPIAQLARDYPGVMAENLAIGDPKAHSVHGLVVDGVNYVSSCTSRAGDYPYCEVMDLPSFSTAKSIFAGIALMRLEALAPGMARRPLRAFLPSVCAPEKWSQVTFLNALDMASGNFDSDSFESDENAAGTNGLFLPPDHASKIDYACNTYPHRAAPGERWVYHTSDTYVLGTALSTYLRTLPGREHEDLYADLVVREVFAPLGLSQVARTTRRTYDAVRQPFTGWGLTYHHDDIARLAAFLSSGEGKIGNRALLDRGLLAAALQRQETDRGLETAGLRGFRYQHGFWARDLQDLLTCSHPLWVPFMSGYGGISVVMFPNGVVYYNFSDDGETASFDWSGPARVSNRIRPICS